MTRLFASLALVAVVGAVAVPGAYAQSSSGNDRVVGGRPAARGAWPWQVKIYAADPQQRGRSSAHCGGTVIAPQWVLTAAHCFVSAASGRQALDARDIVLVAGETELPRSVVVKAGDKRYLRAQAVVLHPDFDIRTFQNDVALVQLQQPSNVKPVPLPSEDVADTDLAGLNAVVTGWGFTSGGQTFDTQLLPTALQEVELPLVSIPVCRDAYAASTMRGYSLDHRNLCAGFAEGGKDACQGDSGGPLVARTTSGWSQVGIVSWGEGCAARNRYGVYTRVAAFESWIRNVTGNAPAPSVPPIVPGAPTAVPAAPAPVASVAPPAPMPAPAPAPAPAPTPAPVQAPPAPLSPVLPAVAGGAEQGDRALLIGIDAYPGPLRLSGSTADVKAEYELLTGVLGYKPEQIMVLTDEKATRAGILDAIDHWLIEGSKPGARVFLHFSGHGFQAKDLNGDEEDGLDETLVPVDVEIVRGPSGKVTDVRNQIIDDEIADRMARLRDRQVVAVFDSCHSGTVTRDVANAGIPPEDVGSVRSLEAVLDLDPAFARTLAGGTRSVRALDAKPHFVERIDDAVVWSAVAEDQLALVDRSGPQPMGVFTRRFVQGVRDLGKPSGKAGRKADRSLAQLLDYVRTQSAAYCETKPDLCKAGLTPQLEAPPARLGEDAVTGEAPASTAEAVQETLGSDNAAGLTLDIVPGNEVAVGQTMSFRVSARKAGYLVLLDVDASGKLTQIFPNKRSMAGPKGADAGANLLKAGKTLTVPDPGNPYQGFEYAAEEPAGAGLVVAVLSSLPVQVIDLPDVPVTMGGQRAALDYVYTLAKTLRIAPTDEAGRVVQPKWSFASHPYVIR